MVQTMGKGLYSMSTVVQGEKLGQFLDTEMPSMDDLKVGVFVFGVYLSGPFPTVQYCIHTSKKAGQTHRTDLEVQALMLHFSCRRERERERRWDTSVFVAQFCQVEASRGLQQPLVVV